MADDNRMQRPYSFSAREMGSMQSQLDIAELELKTPSTADLAKVLQHVARVQAILTRGAERYEKGILGG